jgi:hypothetical protein
MVLHQAILCSEENSGQPSNTGLPDYQPSKGKVQAKSFHEKAGCVTALQRAFQDGRLTFHGDLPHLTQPKTFAARLRPLFRKDWVV